jgi:hypothetical protein
MSFVCRHLIGEHGGVICLSYGMFRYSIARIHAPSGAGTHNPRVKDMSRPVPRGDSGGQCASWRTCVCGTADENRPLSCCVS